ncbi:hypothetical protein XHV734_0520 [Xanthomonas hortorum pv. vitians]|nr:hypothetical protein XHV734_0520 [Xanthomonas hortorum pv. vitians]
MTAVRIFRSGQRQKRQHFRKLQAWKCFRQTRSANLSQAKASHGTVVSFAVPHANRTFRFAGSAHGLRKIDAVGGLRAARSSDAASSGTRHKLA